MAFSTKVSEFRSPAATGVQSIGGVGFQPKVVLLWSGINASAGTFATNARFSIGFGVSSASQRAVGVGVQGGVSTTRAARRWAQRALMMVSVTGTIEGDTNLETLWSDGFNLNWTTIAGGATVSRWVNYCAIGGAD